MMWDNYAIQAAQAKKLFLTYDQQYLIDKCRLRYDDGYLYTEFLSSPYRISRQTGDLQRQHEGQWIDGNSFPEVMTLLDWLCDGKADRFISGQWVNMVDLGHAFHTQLQEDGDHTYGAIFDDAPQAFCKACERMGGKRVQSADISYAIPLLDGLEVLIQLWHGDDEFPPRLRCLWDKNTLQYIRYETTWYAKGLLLDRIKGYL